MLKNNTRHNNIDKYGGFTLVEVLLATSIMSFIFLAVSSFYYQTVELDKRQMIAHIVNTEALFIAQVIEAHINESIGINGPVANGSGSVLSLERTSAGVDPTTISLSGTSLQLQEGVGTAIAINSSDTEINSFNVEYDVTGLGFGIVTVDFSIQANVAETNSRYQYQKDITLSVHPNYYE